MTLNLDTLVLARGAHKTPDQGMCVLEAVAFLAKESFTDHPDCTSPVVGAFLRSLNDQWDDTRRQTLKKHIPTLIGTNTGADDDETRAWMATDWLVRVHTPAFLRLAGLTEHADRLAGMPELRPDTVPSIKPALDAARSDASKARAAAGDAAGAAAWDAAWDAAGDAARDAAWAAAWDAAGAAARDAARDAAWDAAGDAAGDAAWAAARDAAGDAAWAAARDALLPTVEGLQPSIHDLIERMCAVGRAS